MWIEDHKVYSKKMKGGQSAAWILTTEVWQEDLWVSGSKEYRSLAEGCCTEWDRDHILSRPRLSFIIIIFHPTLLHLDVIEAIKSAKLSTDPPTNANRFAHSHQSWKQPRSQASPTQNPISYVLASNLLYQQSNQPHKENRARVNTAKQTYYVAVEKKYLNA
jgi:hypothetical protein